VPGSTSILKRLLVGRPFRSDRRRHTLLPKRIALPVHYVLTVLTAMNLRGIREAGAAFAIPTYGFMIVIKSLDTRPRGEAHGFSSEDGH
jgi:hypothetical protein